MFLILAPDVIAQYTNFDLDNIVTLVNTDVFVALLEAAGYEAGKIDFIRDGFRNGFDLGYQGPEDVQAAAPILPFRVGTQADLWNKVMDEVKVGRYAGPYRQIPFEHYIQSPIGLVPKDGGRKTRLIFHLSFPRTGVTSVNHNTPSELCSVKYLDLDDAITMCLKAGQGCHIAKSDLISAFRILGIKKKFWKYLVMKAQSPIDQKIYYFVDKCMPFGSSISCANFQQVSNAISFLVSYRTGCQNVNYLDDYFFCSLLKLLCNNQVKSFLQVCAEINFPVSQEKMVWANTLMTFLGLLIDTMHQVILIPLDKLAGAIAMLDDVITRKKITLKTLQKLCGTLNFLCRCIIPGRAFTRCLYAAGAGLTKPHHHLNVNKEMKEDLAVWKYFLSQPDAFCRPFIDSIHTSPEDTDLHTDASRNFTLGAGGYCGPDWFIFQWDEEFMNKALPSIDYREFYALTVGITLWLPKFRNRRITVHCDNLGVVHMVNNNSSNCKNCMVLIRHIVMQSLIHNTHVFASHVLGKNNRLADCLSRLRYDIFRKESRRVKKYFRGRPAELPASLWPMDKIWLN